MEVDTANWAEPWEVIKERIYSGFEAIAQRLEASGGGNAIVVSHGMTIGTFIWLLDEKRGKTPLDNGSITVVSYDNGRFTIEKVADMTYRHRGREILDKKK